MVAITSAARPLLRSSAACADASVVSTPSTMVTTSGVPLTSPVACAVIRFGPVGRVTGSVPWAGRSPGSRVRGDGDRHRNGRAGDGWCRSGRVTRAARAPGQGRRPRDDEHAPASDATSRDRFMSSSRSRLTPGRGRGSRGLHRTGGLAAWPRPGARAWSAAGVEPDDPADHLRLPGPVPVVGRLVEFALGRAGAARRHRAQWTAGQSVAVQPNQPGLPLRRPSDRDEGRAVVAEGAPADVVDAPLMKSVLDLPSIVMPEPVTGTPMVVPNL